MSDIEIRVKKTVAEQLGVNVDSVANDKSFVDLGANNAQLTELFKALEIEFQMRIDSEEKIKTVQSAIEYAKRHANIHIV